MAESSYSYEIVHWAASDTAKSDLVGTTRDALAILKSKTPLPIFTGVSPDNGELYWVIAWDETATHKALMNSPEYAPYSAKFAPQQAPGATVDMVHAHFDADRAPLAALAAPRAQVVYVRAKEGVELGALQAALGKITELLSEEEMRAYATGAAWATLEERPDTLLLIVGWNSAEDHKRAVAPDGPLGGHIAELRTILDPAGWSHAYVPFVKQA